MEFYFVQIVIVLFLSLHLNIVAIHIIIFQELKFKKNKYFIENFNKNPTVNTVCDIL